VTVAASDVDSAEANDWIESMGSGATTPPMKPMLHGLGGGAAFNDATVHAPLSVTAGSSAVCTVPLRPSNVTDAGCGTFASCAAAFAVSGTITKARDGDSATTSNNGPALGSQLRSGSGFVESTAATGFPAVESVWTGGFARSHANPIAAALNNRERRNRFI
jgi:hypothetical protein